MSQGTRTASQGAGSHDLLVAVALGVAVELTLSLRVYVLAGRLAGGNAWLEISQMPGVNIAMELCKGGSWLQAFLCTAVVQCVIFIIDFLGMIYAYRLLKRAMSDAHRRAISRAEVLSAKAEGDPWGSPGTGGT